MMFRLLLSTLGLISASAFVPQQLALPPKTVVSNPSLTLLSATTLMEFEGNGSVITASAGDILRNIASVVLGLGAIVALFIIVFSTVIIPKAAEQLELQVREQYPELWQEYASQLKEGETLVMRPDLMQSLGDRVQKLTLADFEQQHARYSASQGQPVDEPEPKGKMDVFEDIGVNTRPPVRSPVSPKKDVPDIIDADIIDEK